MSEIYEVEPYDNGGACQCIENSNDVKYEILVYPYVRYFSISKFSSGREASDIYKAILGLSVMKRSILAALIVAVSL